MADEATNRAAFEVQAQYCDAMAAPRTARLCRVLGQVLTRDTRIGARLLGWAGEPVADAIVLRVVGGLHALRRCGAADAFAPDADIAAILTAHDVALLPWLDGPPQTNEVQRSAGLMAGLLHVAQRFALPIEVLEIGSSAGLNLLIDRLRFDLGGVAAGPADAPLTIRPEWRGAAPPAVPVTMLRPRGVDLAPVDVRDPAQAERLAGYIWVDNEERMARLSTAIAMVRQHGVDLSRGDAADWIEARFAAPQRPGTARVLMHSVVWQYLPAATRERIRAAMAQAGARATPAQPLGWVMMEPNRDLHRHEVRVQCWPSDTPMELVALTHAHGAWVEGLPPPYETRDYVMRRGAYE
ncbi:MAG: DUF2332 domain-containing protein [Sphingomonas taxi]|uniref:DUF2332 domain-containing protein n=1 Tax=Sphingomonas taxi TaxID=1549858 RepID=A0A2W5P5P8_9SPHN|nr:MAG: DUF2332 domain-containing protein [Sphingomonas taxi]